MYCTLWEECKQTQCPHRSWRERTKALMWYYSPTKNKLIYQVRANTYDFWLSCLYGKYNSNIFLFHPLPWGLIPQKWWVAPELFVLISSPYSTQIWRIRYGGSWGVYIFLDRDLGKLAYYCHYDRVKNKPLREKNVIFFKHPAVCQIDWKHRT